MKRFFAWLGAYVRLGLAWNSAIGAFEMWRLYRTDPITRSLYEGRGWTKDILYREVQQHDQRIMVAREDERKARAVLFGKVREEQGEKA